MSELLDGLDSGDVTELLAYELVEYRDEWSRTGKQCETQWSSGLMAAAARGAKVTADDFQDAEYFVPPLAKRPKRRKQKVTTQPPTSEPQRSGLEAWMQTMANPKLWGR